MKKIILISLFAILNITLNAQSKNEKALAEVYNSLVKAMIDADGSQLAKLSSTNISYGHSSGLVENQAQFIEAIVSGKNDFKAINVSDQTVQVSGKIGIVRNKLLIDAINNGVPAIIKINTLNVFEKKGKNWLLTARQGYRLPQ